MFDEFFEKHMQLFCSFTWKSSCCCRDCMQSMPITTDVVSWNPAQTSCTRYNITW